jgi:2'-5' RNA ligase
MQAKLRQALKERGFRVDSRQFQPHVTLARKVGTAPAPAAVAPVAWPVDELALVESETTPNGSRYTPLARWRRGARDRDFAAH